MISENKFKRLICLIFTRLSCDIFFAEWGKQIVFFLELIRPCIISKKMIYCAWKFLFQNQDRIKAGNEIVIVIIYKKINLWIIPLECKALWIFRLNRCIL